mmetsp:Transcript_116694/g.182384  ORF Transcript_116694/g.182384 Transcript_116694/m.182384 type:complete len:1063 (-) Transcript_116694:255-3443(-)
MGNAGTCACNHSPPYGTKNALAHAVDVHVRCTCPQESVLREASAVGESPHISKAIGSYEPAGCEQVPQKKRCKRKQLPSACPCEDTDTFSRDVKMSAPDINLRVLAEQSVDTWQCQQKILHEEGVDVWQSPQKVTPHVKLASDSDNMMSQQGFAYSISGKQEEAEDTDTTTRRISPSCEDAPECVFESLDVDSDSDNETEQEPMPWQRPRKGGVCCGGVAKSTFIPPVYAKDRDTNSKLKKSLRECALFKDLRPAELDTIINTIVLETIDKGRRIVQQGETGDALYVIIKGSVDCYLEHAVERNGKVKSLNASNLGQFIVSRQAGDIFGELSIIWNTPRSLSVYAHDSCVLGRLERDVYQALVVHRAIRIREQHELCLRSAKLLETLNDEQLAKLVDALELKTFKKGKPIINQGDEGKDFFIVQSGECIAVMQTGNDYQECRRYVKGDLFGELALINKAPRAASIIAETSVEVLRLSCRSFERMLGSLALLQQDSYKTDPRKLIADFFRPGDSRGPFGSLQQLEVESPEQPSSSWFAVFRPTSRDAIAKMLNGNAVGKGLNVKGKSAKKNRLSGYVPFVQISDNEHKQIIEKMPETSRVRVFYRNEAARQDAFDRLSAAQLELRARRKHDKVAKERAKGRASIKSTKSNRSRTSLTSIDSKSEAPKMIFDDRYIPHAYGIFVPGDVLHEVYITQRDLSPLVDWETGRKSEPAFMDMNTHAICGASSPQIVLYQHDEGDPMNPMGLLLAYAEKFVKPVVSDFDAFLVASKGMNYAELADEQTELVDWCLEATRNILRTSGSETWMSRWLDFLKSEHRKGFNPNTPKTGFGDPTSVRLIEDVIAQTSACGAVRHGAECFNYYFPQDLDEEYLVVWDEFPGIPWKYMSEPELRKFLIERVHAGFSFPLNPVWPVRDPGWFEVLAALRNSSAAEENLRAWYPKANILQKIDEIHAEFPDGFCAAACNKENVLTYGNEGSLDGPGGIGRGSCDSPLLPLGCRGSCDVDMSLHQLHVDKTKTSSSKFKKFRGKVWGGSNRSRSSWLPSFSRWKNSFGSWRGSAMTATE